MWRRMPIYMGIFMARIRATRFLRCRGMGKHYNPQMTQRDTYSVCIGAIGGRLFLKANGLLLDPAFFFIRQFNFVPVTVFFGY